MLPGILVCVFVLLFCLFFCFVLSIFQFPRFQNLLARLEKLTDSRRSFLLSFISFFLSVCPTLFLVSVVRSLFLSFVLSWFLVHDSVSLFIHFFRCVLLYFVLC